MPCFAATPATAPPGVAARASLRASSLRGAPVTLSAPRSTTTTIRNKGRCPVRCAAAGGLSPMTLHMGETTVAFPLPASEAQVMEIFKAKEKEGQRKRLDLMEYSYKGEIDSGEVHLEVVCNPNAYENAFQAKVLVNIKDDRINFTSECLLSALKNDVDNFVDQASVNLN